MGGLTPASPVHCPDCRRQALVPARVRGDGSEPARVVGLCPSCGGVAIEHAPGQPDVETASLTPAEGQHTCPQGHATMHAWQLPTLERAALDICPVCRGLWVSGAARRALVRGPGAAAKRLAAAGRGVVWVAQILTRLPVVVGGVRTSQPWRLYAVALALVLCYVASVLGIVYARDFALRSTAPMVEAGRAYTLLTHVFFHADWYHILGNLYFLYMFGRAVEHALGGALFLVAFFSAGVLGGLAQALLAPASASLVLGASGAIAGIMGVHLWIYPRDRVLQVLPFVFIQLEIPLWVYLGVWFVGQASMAFTMYALGLAWCAHLTGFLYGLVAAALGARMRPSPGVRA